jgi:hypothetical protein
VTPLEKYGGYGLGIVLGLLLIVFNRPMADAFASVTLHSPTHSLPREDRPERIQQWREMRGLAAAFWRFAFVAMGSVMIVFCVLALLGLLD